MKFFYFLGLLQIFFFSAQAETSVSVLCLGDSLTAGYGLERSQAYPALLQKKLSAKGQFAVINAGVSGNTSAGGLRRVDWYFKKKVDVLILALGANDGLRGINTESTKKNLQLIIDKARKKNPQIKILLAGMKVPTNMGAEYASSFEKIFPALAKANNCRLIPFLLEGVGGLATMNLADGIHPNIAGQKQVCENVYKELQLLLADKSHQEK